MPKIIDHDKRKEAILYKALQVFAVHGYQNTSLSMIAYSCDISRPTIYQYFHDKEEIFYFAVKKVTGDMFSKYVQIAFYSDGPIIDRLKGICEDIISIGYENREALTALTDVMVQRKRLGSDFSDIIIRRTSKLNILFRRLLRYGVDRGELKFLDIHDISTQLFMLIESLGFQMALMDNFQLKPAIEIITIFLDSLKLESA
ncbi:MAG: TetR/AcrR family transcriptional regulator [Spirochaetales bacterium]|nr:TetR/AcrR family transcriptional regulator [Spirochaetales bacterium]